MNKTKHGLLRALLITFGIINIIGIVWYSNTLSTIVLLCGVTSCVAAFILGISDFQPTKTSIITSSVLIVFAIAGIVASVARVFYDTDMLRDLWGAIPHLLSLALFAYTLKVILKSKKVTA